jgi:hypothetical protein
MYRQSDDTIQCTKIAMALLATEQGKLSANAGKNLDDLNDLEGQLDLGADSGSEDEEEIDESEM